MGKDFILYTLVNRPLSILKMLLYIIVFILLVKEFPIIGSLFLLLIIIQIVIGYYVYRKRIKINRKAADILQKVREISGADVIGRAMHVAGHPLLDREQSLILALLSDRLVFFTDKNTEQAADIDLDSIKEVKTVIYDKERNPRTDVLDSAAQALQIEFNIKGATYTAMFRKMRGMRPIDWYHSLQQARFKQQ